MKREVINNNSFEIKRAKGELHPDREVRVLSDCYNKPSLVKQEIYDSWLKWYIAKIIPFQFTLTLGL